MIEKNIYPFSWLYDPQLLSFQYRNFSRGPGIILETYLHFEQRSQEINLDKGIIPYAKNVLLWDNFLIAKELSG